jgi:hypothetical protein
MSKSDQFEKPLIESSTEVLATASLQKEIENEMEEIKDDEEQLLDSLIKLVEENNNV